MGFGLATTSGAVLTAVGTGDLQELVRSLSGEPAADPVADQLQQTATIARLENDVRTLIDEISDLKAQRQAAPNDPAVTERFARIDVAEYRLGPLSAKQVQRPTEPFHVRL